MERGNTADALRIYRRAALGGSGKAAYRLGQIYMCGVPGVARDYGESIQWLEKARLLGETIPGRISCSKSVPNIQRPAAVDK